MSLALTKLSEIEDDAGRKKSNKISFPKWNLNEIAVQNFSEVFLLWVMVTTYDYDFINFSELFLYSSLNSLNSWINIEGHSQGSVIFLN